MLILPLGQITPTVRSRAADLVQRRSVHESEHYCMSAGAEIVTFSVAAHSVPRAKVTANTAFCISGPGLPSGHEIVCPIVRTEAECCHSERALNGNRYEGFRD